MRLEELKKGLWGYQKEGVFQYITAQEEAFSQRLMEKDAQAEREAASAQKRIAELEQEVSTLRRELETLRGRQDMISSALLDARSCAEAMKAESQAQEAAARQTVQQKMQEDLACLEGCRKQIEELRRSIRAALQEMEKKTEELVQQAETLSEDTAEANLSLFR